MICLGLGRLVAILRTPRQSKAASRYRLIAIARSGLRFRLGNFSLRVILSRRSPLTAGTQTLDARPETGDLAIARRAYHSTWQSLAAGVWVGEVANL
jgi:hypothetical protein